MKLRAACLFPSILLLATTWQALHAEIAPGMPPPAVPPAQARAKSFSGTYVVTPTGDSLNNLADWLLAAEELRNVPAQVA